MTVGEKIQKYRKELGMSQDELGQKLFVSRQTISLWENSQTVPTIDNLIRLREIFGVSVDNILDLENDVQENSDTPNESYQFHFTNAEVNEIYRIERNTFYKRPIIFTLACIFLITLLIASSAPVIFIGLFIGVLFVGMVSHIKAIRLFKITWKKNCERLSNSTYDYKIYENHLMVSVYRENEKTYESKCDFNQIDQIQVLNKWMFFQHNGHAFIVRKNDLDKNSFFYSFVQKNATKQIVKNVSDKWSILSTLLFVVSIVSIFPALFFESLLSTINHLSTENMWIFFLFTPIPIASIICGFVLKAKGYKYKKNLIVGIIMTVLLCLYGSFTFIFSDMSDHSDKPIAKIEQLTGINIPEHRQINTQDFTKGAQSVSRGYLYYSSDVYFEERSVEVFEKQLAADEKWLETLPNDLIGISAPYFEHSAYDYQLIYNTDTAEYNTLPDTDGTFHFISILYHAKSNQMKIIEYDIDYVK